MRRYTVKCGHYKGIHKIYESLKEAEEAGIIDVKSPWWDSKVQTGDWVESDDGFIVQCLNKPANLINKRHRSGQYTEYFRFPMGNAYVYHNKKGELKRSTFYAIVSYSNKNSLGNTPAIGRGLTIRKREFILYMSMGYDPYTSYIKAYRPKLYQPFINAQIMKLLNDEVVKRELMEALKPFMEQVQQKIREQTGKSINDLIVDHTVELLLTKPTDVIKMKVRNEYELEMFGKQLGLTIDSKQSSREIANAQFEVLPPPQLGTSS